MQLIATPTLPTDLTPGQMLDLPSIEDEYVTLAWVEPVFSDEGTAVLVVNWGGDNPGIASVAVPVDEPVRVITYGLSNTLEADK